MYVLSALLTFTNPSKSFEIRRVKECKIEASFKDLTAKAEIVLPRNVTDFDKNNIADFFKKGDQVKIELGYDGVLYEEFSGYITQVSADIPIVIQCEDSMYILKKTPVNFSAKSVDLKTLLESIQPYKVDADNIQLGSVRYANTTVAQVLEKIKEDYGIYSYFDQLGVLVSGKYYSDNTADKIETVHLERIPSNDLQYKNPGFSALKIKGKTVDLKGKQLKYEHGEDGGDVLELEYRTAQVLAELTRRVKEDYDKKVKQTFDGKVTLFGLPRVYHGQKIDLVSELYPDRNGRYKIESFVKTFGLGGYRQELQVER